MTLTIKLPDNIKEANFILELLQKLNIPMAETVEQVDIPEGHKLILKGRIENLKLNTSSKTYTWEEVKKLKSKRKVSI
jgi:hypothetical protein